MIQLSRLHPAVILFRVELLAIFEKLVFAITFRILRILMEHIKIKNSLESKLQSFYICSFRILNILKVIAILIQNTYLLEKSNLSLGDFESGGGVSVENTEWNIVE